MVLGRQLGSVKPGEYDVMKDGRWQFRHDVQSWTELWNEVGRETGTKWKVQASLDEVDFGFAQNREWGDADMRRLLFQVVRHWQHTQKAKEKRKENRIRQRVCTEMFDISGSSFCRLTVMPCACWTHIIK